jgi:hypothetical protein
MDGIGHAALLTRVRKARAAALDGDRQRLQREATNLLAAFGAHIAAERELVQSLPERLATALAGGQRKLHDALIALAVESEADEPCDCDRLGADVEALLTLQAAQEDRVFTAVG